MTRRISRRSFLRAGAAAGGAVVVGGCADASAAPAEPEVDPTTVVSFLSHIGAWQPGVVTPAPRHAIIAVFDTTAASLDQLRSALTALSIEVDLLTSGTPSEAGDPLFPPPDNRIIGTTPDADDLTVTVALGASVFDDRFGLAPHAPRQLTLMPSFPNDRLDPARTHGDLLVQICSQREIVAHHALRRLMLATRDTLTLRWMQAGFQELNTLGPGRTSTRNLLGFKDGTANLDTSDATVIHKHVWVSADDDEPAWTVGGTYMVSRIIRNRVEFWDRTPLATQELIMGRRKDSGAPLSGDDEAQTPEFDEGGEVTPLSAHIRLANPRTPGSEANLILRRGFNFANGFSADGQLDQGLLFVCFQRSMADGFLTVQGRLDGEALEEYIRPVGGGFFFAPPGRTAPGEPFAAGLLAVGGTSANN
jgi:deferrochelatase/peroxidase EfeB